MNVLLIDNYNIFSTFSVEGYDTFVLPFNTISINDSGDIYSLVLLIKSKIEAVEDRTDTIIFINIYLEIGLWDVHDMVGIHLLKWLRLEGIHQHVVLFGSILTAEELIVYNPHFFIVASQGVTVTREYGYFKAGKVFTDRLKLQAPKERGYFRPFIKVEFSMPEDERHNWANWWGIKKLYDVYNAGSSIQLPYPDPLKRKINKLASAQALYLYEPLNDLEFQKYLDLTEEHHRTNLIRRPKRILYIDDQADDGWAEIFCQIFYDSSLLTNTSFFNVYNPKQNEDISLISQTVLQKIATFNPDLVLLDLRLQREIGFFSDVESLSGAKVLKYIRQNFIGLPIIIVTASNKIRSSETLERLGSDGYWIKEGLDGSISTVDSIENYYKLIRLVEQTTGEEYQFLNRLGRVVTNLEGFLGSYWWENHLWRGVRTNRTTQNQIALRKYIGSLQRDRALNRIRCMVDFLRLYFRVTVLKLGNQSKEYSQSLIHSILIMLCRNIEEVHREKKLDPKTSGKRSQQYSNVDAGGYHTGKIWLRAHNGDFLAYYLYLIRNVTIHYTQPGSTIIDTPTFCFFIACYITWLNNPYKLIKLADLDPKLSTNNIRRIIANIKYIIDNPNYYHDFKRPVQELFQSFQAL